MQGSGRVARRQSGGGEGTIASGNPDRTARALRCHRFRCGACRRRNSTASCGARRTDSGDGFRRWIPAGIDKIDKIDRIDKIDKSEGLSFLVDGPDPSVASCYFICSEVTPVRTAVASDPWERKSQGDVHGD